MCVVLGILIGEFFPFERQLRALQIYLGIIILFFLLFEGVLTGYFVENARYSLFYFDWNNLGISYLPDFRRNTDLRGRYLAGDETQENEE